MLITDNPIWFTPTQAYSDYQGEVSRVGLKEVNTLTKYQKIRETRTLAILCLAIFKMTGSPWYLQLVSDESTDGRIMSPISKTPGVPAVGNVEISSYTASSDGRLPLDSAIDRLKKTKAPESHHEYGVHDLVVVELGVGIKPNFEEIAAYLRSINAPYGLWYLQQVELDNPNSIAEVTICNPTVEKFRLDVGEAEHELREQGIRGKYRARRTGDVSKAGLIDKSTNEIINGAPWDNM